MLEKQDAGYTTADIVESEWKKEILWVGSDATMGRFTLSLPWGAQIIISAG